VNTYSWYSQLIKPSWAPPAWLFGPVWTVLYAIIALTYGTLFYKAFKGELAWKLTLPLALNLVFNLAFTPIQFGLRNNFLAAVDILLVVATLLWAFAAIWQKGPQLRWVVYANLPYFLWSAFATVLQLTITFLNR